jgi:hypothetical protein
VSLSPIAEAPGGGVAPPGWAGGAESAGAAGVWARTGTAIRTRIEASESFIAAW